MDSEEFRSILMNSGVDVWTLIETAISVASLEYGNEFKDRRGGIVERLYAPVVSRCRNCDYDRHEKLNSNGIVEDKHRSQSSDGGEVKGGGFPLTPPESVDRDENDEEQTKIVAIKEHLEDPDQSEDSLVDLLQSLADMDITFKALKETDIGRHVNRLKKHSSNEVRRLVKQLVRKWKDLVDEWVRLNTPGGTSASALVAVVADGDSPQQTHQRSNQNGHHQVPDFAYSPNPHYGNYSSDKNSSEPEQKGRVVPRREAPPKRTQSVPVSASVTPNKQREQKESLIDPEKLASAKKRLHENYQEAQNAKKQRTIQVMDLHDIPKPKNTFFAKNRGGVQAKHW